MSISIKVLGAPELQRMLNSLDDKLSKKIVRKALRQAIKPVAAYISAHAPVQTGALKRSFKVRARKYKGRKKFGVMVVAADEKVNATHARTSKKGKKYQQKNAQGGNRMYYAGFNELGTRHQPPRPFMRPAIHGQKDALLGIVKREIASGLAAEVKK